jgi:hypothetical protein
VLIVVNSAKAVALKQLVSLLADSTKAAVLK